MERPQSSHEVYRHYTTAREDRKLETMWGQRESQISSPKLWCKKFPLAGECGSFRSPSAPRNRHVILCLSSYPWPSTEGEERRGETEGRKHEGEGGRIRKGKIQGNWDENIPPTPPPHTWVHRNEYTVCACSSDSRLTWLVTQLGVCDPPGICSYQNSCYRCGEECYTWPLYVTTFSVSTFPWSFVSPSKWVQETLQRHWKWWMVPSNKHVKLFTLQELKHMQWN